MNNWPLPLPFGNSFVGGWANTNPWLHLLFIELPIVLAPALFTQFLPRLLGYRAGGMAAVGSRVSLLCSVLLLVQLFFLPDPGLYAVLHPWLYGFFYLYALAGAALCAVGLYDRKRSAVWAMLAVLALTLGAMHDTCVWFGLWAGRPWVPFGFLLFGLCLLTGFIRKRADPACGSDLRQQADTTGNNRTRRSRSITRRLLREGELHWLPLYGCMQVSDMAREGILHSGSYHFADHIYRSEPSGWGFPGRLLDARLLALPASRAFRERYIKSRDAMQEVLDGANAGETVRILAIPCGLPRDLVEWSQTLSAEQRVRIEYHGMDLDPVLLEKASSMAQACDLGRLSFHQGNALVPADYPEGPFDLVVSTGLGEFLKDEELRQFYGNIHRVLKPGGLFYTSATAYDGRSERFLHLFELHTHYRDAGKLGLILEQQTWRDASLERHASGLQTFVRAVR